MQSIWTGIRAGVGDVRWAFYFAAFLFPVLAIAVLIAAVLGWWDTSQPPGPAVWLLVAPAILFSLFLAGRQDGPDGRLGGLVLMLVMTVVAMLLIRQITRAIQKHGAKAEGVEHTRRVAFGDCEFVITMTAHVEEKVPDLRRVRRSILDQITRPASEGGERSVLIRA